MLVVVTWLDETIIEVSHSIGGLECAEFHFGACQRGVLFVLEIGIGGSVEHIGRNGTTIFEADELAGAGCRVVGVGVIDLCKLFVYLDAMTAFGLGDAYYFQTFRTFRTFQTLQTLQTTRDLYRVQVAFERTVSSCHEIKEFASRVDSDNRSDVVLALGQRQADDFVASDVVEISLHIAVAFAEPDETVVGAGEEVGGVLGFDIAVGTLGEECSHEIACLNIIDVHLHMVLQTVEFGHEYLMAVGTPGDAGQVMIGLRFGL